jgi:putative nucleotidyltransferase with HDIG domain
MERGEMRLGTDTVNRTDVAPRLVLLAFGMGLAVTAVHYLGFTLNRTIVIAVVTGVLAVASTELPWGGFLLPLDALVLAVTLIVGRVEVAVLGLGAALAGASVVPGWRTAAMVLPLRTLGAVVFTVVVWQHLLPVEAVATGGAHSLIVGSYLAWLFSPSAIPALLVCCVVYFATGSLVEMVLRSRRAFNFRQFWLLNFGRNLHHLVFTLLIGALVAVAYVDMGVLAFVLFAFPLLLTRDALRRSLDLRKSRVEALRALSSSVDARDRYTYDHSNRVSRLAALLAREMGFAESSVEAIESGALLHDIGKLGVDVEILSKPGPLDSDERDAIRLHPLRSAEVVSRVELFHGAIDIVRHHHERPDGTGYPDGLKAHEIPLGARILNVADAFDAMTSDRPYRKARSTEEAVEELKRGSGKEFDPVVVEYLMKLLEKRGYEVAALETD